MAESLYIVWSPSTGQPTKFHSSLEPARDEARRLCQMIENQGREYYVLRACESVKYRTDPFECKVYSKKG